MKMCIFLSVFLCRFSGDWGGRADGTAAEPAEPGCGQNLFCPGAACSAGNTASPINHHMLIINISYFMYLLKSVLCNLTAHKTSSPAFPWNWFWSIKRLLCFFWAMTLHAPLHLSDFESVSAATWWQAGADSFHGDRQPGADAALAHHLPSFILTQQAPRTKIYLC